MTIEQFSESPPDSDRLTEYDREHIKLYCRLLDAVADGADWREAVAILFGLDPVAEPHHSRRVFETHLARAEWMTHTGYRHLLEGRIH